MQLGYIHCIGIGGIGVSALARLYQSRGFGVSGSDLKRSDTTRSLQREGIRVCIGHRKSNLRPRTQLVVASADVPRGNPEIVAAKRRGLAVLTYAEGVAPFTRELKTIAVAGSHGKSTTTALTALILAKSGKDPTVIIGTKLREFGGKNFRAGRSRLFVLEADEHYASFLSYSPAIVVVTNIDREHLDYYQTIANIEAAFLKFLKRLAPGGTAILNRDDERLRRIGQRLRRARRDVRIVWYSLRDPQAKRLARVLHIPGRHNVANALAARAVGRLSDISEQRISATLRAYRGAWRRFDYQGVLALRGVPGQTGAKVFADYAHHPTEIRATLQGARQKFPRARIWCVFQPHYYERLYELFPEFTRAFSDCDRAVFLPVYRVAGRERRRESKRVSSATLARAVMRRGTPATYLADPSRLGSVLSRELQPGDILLMMGAGSIWEMTKQLMGQREQRSPRAQFQTRPTRE